MNTLKHPILATALLATLLPSACANAPPASQTVFDAHCAKATPDNKFEIKQYELGMVSVCPEGSEDDCLYSLEAGKTFIATSLDLNSDGRNDALIKDFTGVYGDHELVHFVGFAQCPDGQFLQIMDDMLATAAPSTSDTGSGWADLKVTRGCYDAASGKVKFRRFTLKFNANEFHYGPPNGDPALVEYCSSKELALPSSTDTTP